MKYVVMAGLGPAIHVFTRFIRKTWMPGIADKFTQSAQTAMAGHDGGGFLPMLMG